MIEMSIMLRGEERTNFFDRFYCMDLILPIVYFVFIFCRGWFVCVGLFYCFFYNVSVINTASAP